MGMESWNRKDKHPEKVRSSWVITATEPRRAYAIISTDENEAGINDWSFTAPEANSQTKNDHHGRGWLRQQRWQRGRRPREVENFQVQSARITRLSPLHWGQRCRRLRGLRLLQKARVHGSLKHARLVSYDGDLVVASHRARHCLGDEEGGLNLVDAWDAEAILRNLKNWVAGLAS